MRFKTVLCIWIAVVLCAAAVAAQSDSVLIDRLVASVNDNAITLSELREKHEAMKKNMPSITEAEALQSMINAQLLLEKARQMRIEGKTPDELIASYIDLKIRAAIVVPEDAINRYYAENREKLGGTDYRQVRDEIENYLTEQETNRLLKEHIARLRAAADIMILP